MDEPSKSLRVPASQAGAARVFQSLEVFEPFFQSLENESMNGYERVMNTLPKTASRGPCLKCSITMRLEASSVWLRFKTGLWHLAVRSAACIRPVWTDVCYAHSLVMSWPRCSLAIQSRSSALGTRPLWADSYSLMIRRKSAAYNSIRVNSWPSMRWNASAWAQFSNLIVFFFIFLTYDSNNSLSRATIGSRGPIRRFGGANAWNDSPNLQGALR